MNRNLNEGSEGARNVASPGQRIQGEGRLEGSGLVCGEL